MVKTLVRSAPVVVFYGSPVYNLYLRLLGARIGSNVVVECRFVPICTDLITIGDNTILRKDSILLGYRAQANFIHTGPVEIGSNAFVGEASVLDIGTVMGNNTQLGHASSLRNSQRIPDGKRYHGSPAQETTSDYCPIASTPCSAFQRGLVDAMQLLVLFAIVIPVPILLLTYWEHYSPGFAGGGDALTWGLLPVSLAAFLGSLAAGALAVIVMPRICQFFLETDKTYSLYGFHYRLQTMIAQFSIALLQSAVRRQLRDRPLHAACRLEPEQGRADRLEFRHQPTARQSVSLRHRQRNDGVRRPVDDQHAPVELVVPTRPNQSRRS